VLLVLSLFGLLLIDAHRNPARIVRIRPLTGWHVTRAQDVKRATARIALLIKRQARVRRSYGRNAPQGGRFHVPHWVAVFGPLASAPKLNPPEWLAGGLVPLD
jgi:hypothetical protein